MATPEQIGQMSEKDFKDYLDKQGIRSEDYGDFARFDPTKIQNIEDLYTGKMKSYDIEEGDISKGFDLGKFGGRSAISGLGKDYRSAWGGSGLELSGGMFTDWLNKQRSSFAKTAGAEQKYTSGLRGLDIDRELAGTAKSTSMSSAYEEYFNQLQDQVYNVKSQYEENQPGYVGEQGFNLLGENDPYSRICAVSTALNDTGVWSDRQKKIAVDWCQDTHHDGTDRGKNWIKGYHTWGKFLSKWVKRSNIVRYIVDTTTTAFIEHTKQNKPNYLGWLIHYGWINPLSYVIGYSKKNKILGKLATFGMIGLYTVLFPLFALISIPHVIKKKLN